MVTTEEYIGYFLPVTQWDTMGKPDHFQQSKGEGIGHRQCID